MTDQIERAQAQTEAAPAISGAVVPAANDASAAPVATLEEATAIPSPSGDLEGQKSMTEIGGGTSEATLDTLAAWVPSFDPQAGFEIIAKGGPVVLILIALSIIATTVIILKLVQFLWFRIGSNHQTERALRYWISMRPEDALAEASRSNTPSTVALAHGLRGLSNGVDERIVREDTERVALEQLGGLRSNMRVLEATVQIAPLLGLFGTVIGMISAFQALQSAGSEADPAVLAGGIWVALMTTAVGLAVAIPVAFFNYWLEGRIERERDNTEAALTSLFTRRATAPPQASGSVGEHIRVVPAAE